MGNICFCVLKAYIASVYRVIKCLIPKEYWYFMPSWWSLFWSTMYASLQILLILSLGIQLFWRSLEACKIANNRFFNLVFKFMAVVHHVKHVRIFFVLLGWQIAKISQCEFFLGWWPSATSNRLILTSCIVNDGLYAWFHQQDLSTIISKWPLILMTDLMKPLTFFVPPS